MSKLKALRDAATRDDVAKLLGFMPKGLSFVLYKIPDDKKYSIFPIPKKNGEHRLISSPEPRLALLQRRLARFLYDCLDELHTAVPPGRRSLAHGFEKRRSIFTNAHLHKRRRYVLNLDLEDFFTSINFGRVRGFFLKDKSFALQPPVATILAQIACHNNGLPQGSPCSPVISNLVGHLLDGRLARFAKQHRCTYSRYADDITFSTNLKQFPAEVADQTANGNGEWVLGAALTDKIEHSGFKINPKKTRMQFRGSRQVTTGLIVNEKVNVRQEYWRETRQMCHALFKTGTYYKKAAPSAAQGAVETPPQLFTKLGPLAGRLAHIHFVKNKSDRREDKDKSKEPTAARTLYRKFLFYKHFVGLDRPVVLPEGKTDSIYLRCAVKKVPAFHPKLGAFVEGKFQSAIRFMNYSATVHDIMGVGHGASQLKAFMASYSNRVAEYPFSPCLFPVIVLVDNDQGGDDVFGVAGKMAGAQISYKSDEPFYFLGSNLYLVKTPSADVAPFTSCIEDFFSAELLGTVLKGKTFDPHKAHDEAGKYGKATFAVSVIEKNVDKVDFSGFAPLLARIVSVLDHFADLQAEAQLATGT